MHLFWLVLPWEFFALCVNSGNPFVQMGFSVCSRESENCHLAIAVSSGHSFLPPFQKLLPASPTTHKQLSSFGVLTPMNLLDRTFGWYQLGALCCCHCCQKSNSDRAGFSGSLHKMVLPPWRLQFTTVKILRPVSSLTCSLPFSCPLRKPNGCLLPSFSFQPLSDYTNWSSTARFSTVPSLLFQLPVANFTRCLSAFQVFFLELSPGQGSSRLHVLQFSPIIMAFFPAMSFRIHFKAVVPLAQTRRIILRDTPVSMGIR